MVSTVPPQLAQTYWRSPLTWLVMRSPEQPGQSHWSVSHDVGVGAMTHATLRGSVPLSRARPGGLLLDGGRRPYRLAKAEPGGRMSLQEAVRYEVLQPEAFEHPADRAATAALAADAAAGQGGQAQPAWATSVGCARS